MTGQRVQGIGRKGGHASMPDRVFDSEAAHMAADSTMSFHALQVRSARARKRMSTSRGSIFCSSTAKIYVAGLYLNAKRFCRNFKEGAEAPLWAPRRTTRFMRQPSAQRHQRQMCRRGSAVRVWLSPARCRSSARSGRPASSVRSELVLDAGSDSALPAVCVSCARDSG